MTSPDDVDLLIATLSDGLGTMAMVNYPYPTTFVMNLPAWPMQKACWAAGNYTAPTQDELRDDPPTNPAKFNFTHINQLQ